MASTLRKSEQFLKGIAELPSYGACEVVMEKLREVTKLVIDESPLSERGIHLTTYVDLAAVDGDTSFLLVYSILVHLDLPSCSQSVCQTCYINFSMSFRRERRSKQRINRSCRTSHLHACFSCLRQTSNCHLHLPCTIYFLFILASPSPALDQKPQLLGADNWSVPTPSSCFNSVANTE